MHTLKRAPQKSQSFYLCSQCRHASTFRSLQERSYILRNRVHQARTARREDWALGPLAPNRIGNDDNYGCVEPTETKGIKNLDLVRKGRSPHMSKEMKWEDNMIEKGDRVVIIATEGPASRDRGKVGRVREVRKDRWEVMIDGLNMADVNVPRYVRNLQSGTPPTRTVPLPIPLSAVRLVYPLQVLEETDDAGNVTRESYYQDTIVSKIVSVPGLKGRYIANSEKALGRWVEIVQNTPEKKQRTRVDREVDTLRFEVEEETWIPTLLRAPMPGAVIDELRNKYSKYRTRHEPSYQRFLDARELRKAEYKAWATSGGGSANTGMLRSPAQEARAKEVAQMVKKGKPELKMELLERIGEVMAKKGIEMTDERRMEVERNLEKEQVLSGVVKKEEEEDDRREDVWLDAEGSVVMVEDEVADKIDSLSSLSEEPRESKV